MVQKFNDYHRKNRRRGKKRKEVQYGTIEQRSPTVFRSSLVEGAHDSKTRQPKGASSPIAARIPRQGCLLPPPHWRCHLQARKCAQGAEVRLRAVLGRTQLNLHATRRTPHGASRLVQTMFAWLLKTRRAPFRHSRDTRAYGHTTAAMHELSTPRPRIFCGKHDKKRSLHHDTRPIVQPTHMARRGFGVGASSFPKQSERANPPSRGLP